jgi:hypothetical protein
MEVPVVTLNQENQPTVNLVLYKEDVISFQEAIFDILQEQPKDLFFIDLQGR